MKKAINPNIKTSSKTNSSGEIINPTKSDIETYNKKYQTVRFNQTEPAWSKVGGIVKDAFADQNNLGIVKNTIKGLPSAAVKVGKAIVKPVKNYVDRNARLNEMAIKEMDKMYPSGWSQNEMHISEIREIKKKLKKAGI